MRQLDIRQLEVGMFIESVVGTVRQVDGIGKEKIRLKNRYGKIETFDLPTEPTQVKVIYEVTPEQAVQTVEQQLDGTEIA